MSKRFRASAYRHVTSQAHKKELWYTDIRPTSSNDASSITASAKNVAVTWENGSSIGILKISNVGKRKGTNANVPRIHAHSSQIYDINFSPFSEDHILSCSDDGTVKLWEIPEEGLTEDLSNSSLTLSGHKRRVICCNWNPIAENVGISGSTDKTVKLWDLNTGDGVSTVDVSGQVQSFTWNYFGNSVVIATNDKKLSIWDPRENNISLTDNGHNGVKPTKLTWLGNTDNFASTGFNKYRDRQVGLWDSRDLSKAILMNTIDSSTGIINPMYDLDTKLLFLAGKGDGSVRVYEYAENEQQFYELQQFTHDTGSKSTCLLPKRALDVMNTEVARVLKLTSNSVIPVSFTVPRKSKKKFASDLFPDSISTVPGLSTVDWFDGQNGEPNFMSLDPATRDVDINSIESNNNNNNNNNNNEEEEEEPEPVVESRKLKIPKIVRSSHFRHIAGEPVMRNKFFECIKPSGSGETEPIQCNKDYVGVIWQGASGRVGVFNVNNPRRVSAKQALIECGSTVQSFAFSNFQTDILATGLEDATIKIWKIPQNMKDLTTNHTDCNTTLVGHYSKLLQVLFHPTAKNVLLSTSVDETIKLWDINQENAKSTVDLTSPAWSTSFSYNGEQAAVANRDKKIRIYDLRSNNCVSETNGHTGSKSTRVCWLGNRQKIISAGFKKGSGRELKLFDNRKFDTPLTSFHLDQASGIMTPYYDPDTCVLYLTGKGDGTISYYEIVDDDPYIHLLSKYVTSTPAVGVAYQPKYTCDVKKVELLRMFKLTTSAIEPTYFSVPRTRAEFFQDDIFPPTLSSSPTLTSDEFFNGVSKEPKLIDLCPKGMERLSDAPEIKRKSKYNFAAEIEKADKKSSLTRDGVMNKFFDKMQQFKEDDDEEVITYDKEMFGEQNNDDDDWSDDDW